MATETSSTTTTHVLVAITSTFPVFLSGYYLIHIIVLFMSGNKNCSRPQSEWDLGFAIFAFILFVMGSIGVISRVKPLQIICMVTLITMVVLILAVMMIFLPGESGDKYPRWAKNSILNYKDWGVYQSCIVREKFCEKHDFQGDCCSPPVYCGYQEMNKTWIVPKTGLYYKEDTNCAMWSNENDKLCYNCDKCKATYLFKIVEEWVFRGLCMLVAILVWICCFDLTKGMGN